MQARAVLEAAPEGNYVMIKGSPTDPNADFLRGGQQEVLQEAIDAGDITIVGEAYTDDWLPANAQRNMEQILTQQDNEVDAVVASNDGTAGGVVAALTAQGMEGIPVSGQDGDKAALNRVAMGTQTVSVWKDARELGRTAGEMAVALAGGTALDAVEGAEPFTTPGGNEVNSILLAPRPDHPRQPERRARRGLDHPGRALPGRDRGRRGRLQLTRPVTTRGPGGGASLEAGPAPRPGRIREDPDMSDADRWPGRRAARPADTLELDLRLFGMIGAFVLLCAGLRTSVTGGTFLTPRNIFNIAVQTVSVGIMATGMVFVIVARHIDLSVGSLSAMCSAIMAMTQAAWLPGTLGLAAGHPADHAARSLVGARWSAR